MRAIDDTFKKFFLTYSFFSVGMLPGSDRRLSCVVELSKVSCFTDDFNTSVAAWWIRGRIKITVSDKRTALYV